VFCGITVMMRSNSGSTSAREFVAPHAVFWEPSLEEFWRTADPSTAKAGFPCFLSFLYHCVARGDKGDEDASHILDDLIYIYPQTIPHEFQQALVGGLLSFTTFSRLNLDSMLTAFSWSESEIAIQSIKLTDGNYLVFVLKMPQAFSQYFVNLTLTRTLNAYKITHEVFSREIAPGDVPDVQQVLQSHPEILQFFTFNESRCVGDEFNYGVRPMNGFQFRSVLATSTQLFDFVKNIDPRILGSAIFFKRYLILSSLSHDFTLLLPVYKKMVRPPHSDFTVDRFIAFPLWIPPCLAGTGESPEAVPMTLGVSVWGTMSFFVLIVGHEEVDGILGEVYALLADGIQDFAGECASYPTDGKSKWKGVIAFWPDTGNIQRSVCGLQAMERFAEVHSEFANHEMLQEMTTYDGQGQMTGMRWIDMEVFIEVDAKGPSQDMANTYRKMKTFLQNLPEDLAKL